MRRARRAFGILVAIAVLAMGILSRALTAPPGPVTGAFVAASGAILAIALALAVRILIRLEPSRSKERR